MLDYIINYYYYKYNKMYKIKTNKCIKFLSQLSVGLNLCVDGNFKGTIKRMNDEFHEKSTHTHVHTHTQRNE